jgi:hypothetical protein
VANPVRIQSDTQLLVEGNDQRNFFEAVIDRLSLDGIQTQNFGGIDELRGFVRALSDMSSFPQRVRTIGVVRDAETDAAAAFQSVQSSLRNASLPVPSVPAGVAEGPPRVSILILPGGGQPGMLETLLCETFAGSPEAGCIDDFFKCVTTNSSNGSIRRPEKARARAYLTTKPEPHFSVGVAAEKGYCDFDHDAFANVRGFLGKLATID